MDIKLQMKTPSKLLSASRTSKCYYNTGVMHLVSPLPTILHRKRNDCGIAPVVALHASRLDFIFINIFLFFSYLNFAGLIWACITH